jgi:hypothetical protein
VNIQFLKVQFQLIANNQQRVVLNSLLVATKNLAKFSTLSQLVKKLEEVLFNLKVRENLLLRIMPTMEDNQLLMITFRTHSNLNQNIIV